MTKRRFNQVSNKIIFLLQKLEILKRKSIFIKIDNTPDFNFTDNSSSEEDYYFRNYFKFNKFFTWVTSVNFGTIRIYHYDDFLRLSEEYKIHFDSFKDLKFIKQIHKIDKDAFHNNGFETELDEFKMKDIRLNRIDNYEKRIYYEGKFYGDNYYIDPIDFGYYSTATLIGFKAKPGNFYEEIIAESYLLFLEKKFKLAYFLIFTALENFVNLKLQSHKEKKELKDKVNLAFSSKFSDISKHEIYCSIIGEYDNYAEIRNQIAHGNMTTELMEENVEELFVFILTLILVYEKSLNHFSEIVD